MQIVIDIPEDVYKDIQSHDWKNGGRWYSEEWKAIHNGTPLPKGHGDLIDRSKLVPDCYELEIHDGDDWRNEYCGVSLMQIEQDAEVIVKANGGDADAGSD